MTPLERQVGVYIRDHDGCTSIDVATALKPPESFLKIFGWQRPTSRAIAVLRLELKYVVDVEKRCPACGRAMTRHLKNVPLHLTELGKTMLAPGLF